MVWDHNGRLIWLYMFIYSWQSLWSGNLILTYHYTWQVSLHINLIFSCTWFHKLSNKLQHNTRCTADDMSNKLPNWTTAFNLSTSSCSYLGMSVLVHNAAIKGLNISYSSVELLSDLSWCINGVLSYIAKLMVTYFSTLAHYSSQGSCCHSGENIGIALLANLHTTNNEERLLVVQCRSRWQNNFADTVGYSCTSAARHVMTLVCWIMQTKWT